MSYFLLILFIIFGFLTHTNNNFYGEYSFLELFQATVLLITIFIHLSCKKLYLKLSNSFSFILRLFLFLFLLFEELSFLTKNLISFFPFFETNNFNKELNLHNFTILDMVLFQIPVPFSSQIISVSIYTFVVSFSLFILGYGLYFPYLRKLRYFFLEKKFAIFSFAFLFNLVLEGLIRNLISPSLLRVIQIEFVELFIYILFFLDVIQKKRILIKKE